MSSGTRTGRAAVVSVAFVVALALGNSEGYTQTLPVQWTSTDVGNPALPGSAVYTSGVFTISAGGADIWGESDEFRMVYQPVSGDVDIIARVDSIFQADVWSKAGVMIRASLAPDAAHGLALVSAGRGTAFQRRTTTGGMSTSTSGVAAAAPRWVRLIRVGNTLHAYTSPDGASWTEFATDTIALGTTAYVGIAVTSHDAGAVTMAAVSHVTVTRLPVPFPQRSVDIGVPALASTVTYSRGIYDVRASGADIWGTSDQFNYVYQRISGDFEVAVRIDSLANVHAWSKSGVMVRETLAASSRHASALLSPGNGFAFQRRLDPGGYSFSTAGGATAFPGWVKLVRRGVTFDAFRSSDGSTWVSMGSDTIPMADAVYVGIATTSHDVTARTQSVLDNFSIAAVAAPASGIPTGVAFQKSPDHDTLVKSYELRVFAGGADPLTAVPLARSGLGKPTPGADGTITVDRSAFFSSLAPGIYVATVAAIGSAGPSQSDPVAFTR